MNINSIAYREKAYAKINLSLDITGRRNDGYHTVSMLMQTVTLCDDISVKTRDDGQVTLYGMDLRPWGTGSGESGNCHLVFGPDNLCVKAAEALRKEYGISTGISIYLEKRIPIAAGLAGGSADAAAVLRAVRVVLGLPATEDDLRRLATGLGADVPYCISGGTVLAEGIGEELTPLPAFGPVSVVLVKPAFSISTPESYREYDRLLAERPEIFRRPDNSAMIAALKNSAKSRDGSLPSAARESAYNTASLPKGAEAGKTQDTPAPGKSVDSGMNSRPCAKTGRSSSNFCNGMGNVLRDVAALSHPEISLIEDELRSRGAVCAMMSGSGPTVYGLFEDEETAEQAAGALAEKPGIETAILCRTCNPADEAEAESEEDF